MYKTNKIVIVGGGSAGWMSAATLINYFPNRDITVIESPDVPIMGVGESTLGYIKYWAASLGIDEKDFMPYTDASYKLSIKFTDFYKKDYGGFHYPFGEPFEPLHELGINIWNYKKHYYPETRPEDYCETVYPWYHCLENNRMPTENQEDFPNFDMRWCSAYHFDAVKFANWLRERYCVPRGVKHIQATVKKVLSDEDGVAGLILDDGTVVTSDLYVDCTGWKSLLLEQTLKEPFDSYNDIIPNNRAWATQIPYVDKEKELEGYTNCTAINNGWVWNIPLWSRIGTGYVYSDKYISKEDALEEFKNHLRSDKMTVPNAERITDDLKFKDIEMKVGIHKRTWVKNVIAIGLSAGFIEPLESNGLYSVHEFLLKLVSSINRESVTHWDIDSYNYIVLKTFDGFAKFVSLHYLLSERDDTEYWKNARMMSVENRIDYHPSDSMMDLIQRKFLSGTHDPHSGIHCIANGLNFNVLTEEKIRSNVYYNRSKDYKSDVDKLLNIWKKRTQIQYEKSMNCQSFIDYIQQKFYSN